MAQEKERLVEAITKLVHKFWIDTQHGHTPEFERSFSRLLITRIGDAVLSGDYPELDKMLGVVGRFSVVGADKTVLAWIESIREEHPEIKFVPDLIALRPQAVPGEEGEKGAGDKAS